MTDQINTIKVALVGYSSRIAPIRIHLAGTATNSWLVLRDASLRQKVSDQDLVVLLMPRAGTRIRRALECLHQEYL